MYMMPRRVTAGKGTSVKRIYILLLTLAVLVSPVVVEGLKFRFWRKNDGPTEATVQANGEIYDISAPTDLVQHLQGQHDDLDVQTATDIAAIIASARQDAETMELVRRMREGSGQEAYEAFAGDLTPAQGIEGLAQALSELRMLEVLFEDPRRALVAMQEEGLVPPDRLAEYEANPALLESDTRKSVYFTFVTLAASGGFL